MSGVAANSQKIEVFCAAVPDGMKKWIFELLQFKKAHYL